MILVFKNGVKSIQTAGYNGAGTVGAMQYAPTEGFQFLVTSAIPNLSTQIKCSLILSKNLDA